MPIVIGLGMLLAAAMSAVGAVDSANAAAESAQVNARAADSEANQLDWNASQIKAQTNDDEMRLRVMVRKQMGTTRAASGASGLQLDGSALDILAESAANAEHDAAAIRMSGNQNSNSFLHQAKQRRSYADALRSGADATKLGGMLSAGGTLLSGASQAYGSFQ